MSGADDITPGDRVSYFGGEGTVVRVEGDILHIHTDEGEIVTRKIDQPMVSKTENFESGERVTFPGGEGEVIKVEERKDQPDLLFVHTDEGDLKKVPADKKGLEAAASLADRFITGQFDDSGRFRLRREAARLDLAYRFDRFLSLTGNRIDISPHQVEAAHEILTSHDHRYLLADEVGLGKTIEAGIVIEELIARDRVERVLIISPASLQVQWQEEMKEKFDREYIVYGRDYVETVSRTADNPWEHDDFVITSIDFAKQEDIREELADAEWDMVVVDEAHHLTARLQNDGSIQRTERYKVGEVVSENSDGLLFLTGTPHKGKHDQFYLMLNLLEPYRFEDPEDITPDKLDDLMIRRLKSNPNMLHPDGTPMFPEKHIETLPVEFSEAEEQLYSNITEYLRQHYRRGEEQDARAAGFSMVLYQKRLVSSIRAIQKSLERRAEAIRKGGDDQQLSQLVEHLLDQYRSRPESLTERQRQRVEEELEKQSFVQDPDEMARELEVLEELIDRAKTVGVDSKARKLQEFVDNLFERDPDEKVLIFTEYTDTLEYLRDEVLGDREIAQIHGGLSQAARRKEVERFRNDTDIMLATDAAREGINLQFAHIMVNYDLPWNPIRIDQRMGRLHRYGQEQPVHIYNLFVKNTRENQILERLITKIDRIEDDLGMSSDVLGLVLDDSSFDLEDRIMRAVANDEDPDQVVRDIDSVVEERKEAVKTIQERFLISDQFSEADLEEVQELIEESREDHVGQSEIRELVELFLDEFGGDMKLRAVNDVPGDVYRIDVPDVITLDDEVQPTYHRATFDQEAAIENDQIEFLSLNHPFIQAILEYCLAGDWIDGRTTVMRTTGGTAPPGLLLNFSIGFETADGRETAEEFESLYVTADEEVRGEPPAVTPNVNINDATEHPEIQELIDRADRLVKLGKEEAQRRAEAMASEAEREKEEEVAIKREHAERYFDNAIETWENRLEKYRRQQRQGEDMELPIRNARSKLDELRQERKEEFERFREEASVFPLSPELINGAAVITYE